MARGILLVLCAGLAALSQTTQGLVTGRVVDAATGRPLANAEVAWSIETFHFAGSARSSGSGRYFLPMLSPGVYRLRVSARGYRPQEIHQLTLAVGGRLELNFLLRTLGDVWDSRRHHSLILPGTETIVTFYGPDVDTSRSGSFEAVRGKRGPLESTVSEVIDPVEVRDLPLAGRDVYTMLVALPGVTADAGTSRGLGLSVNGQRPSASNFLLDGIENNDYLVTGPATSVAPEAVQEYAVSINGFSAEYGRSAGFIANAVTRAGGSQWHGTAYGNLKNEVFNANGFRENMLGQARTPLKQVQPGAQAGGPLFARSLFVSSAFDYLRSRSLAESEEVTVPSTTFLAFTAPESNARKLINRFAPPAATNGPMPMAQTRVTPLVSVNRLLLLERLDWMPTGRRHRVMGRFAFSRLDRPDFIWSPYKDFISGLIHDNSSLAFGWIASLRPRVTNEFRFGWTRDDLHWDRAHPEIPTLGALDGTVLPGSPAFYAFRHRGNAVELTENLLWTLDRHVVKFGGGFLLRNLDGYLTAGRDGRYLFFDGLDFAVDMPLFFSAAVDRRQLPRLTLPQYDRQYRYNQFHFFAHDTFKVTPRLALNFGLRYEHFGAPSNTGVVKDGVVDRVRGTVVFPSGSQSLYSARGRSFAPRFGFAWDPRGGGRTLLRGAYGIFYDRPFDNLWLNQRNNNFVLPNFLYRGGDYLAPVSSVLPGYQNQPYAKDFPAVLQIDSGLRNGYVQSYFLGVERELGESWTVEATLLGALGRRLLTTDQHNRRDGTQLSGLPVIYYRAGQGLSSYHALAALARYRVSRGLLQVSYTWGHSTDLQSEPLASDFFDLSFTRIGQTGREQQVAAFTQVGDSRGDRGSSDFDQRHNLVFFSLWNLPGVLRGWRLGQLAAFRTGFPYTVFAPSTLAIYNNRADVVGETSAAREVPGGRQLLDAAGFAAPPRDRTGNSGRNQFRGPGLYNIDLSLSRMFVLPFLGEGGRLLLRADAYNLFNHANLNNPDPFLLSPTFGIATYGRRGRETGFPALAPFQEAARQVQLMVQIEF